MREWKPGGYERFCQWAQNAAMAIEDVGTAEQRERVSALCERVLSAVRRLFRHSHRWQDVAWNGWCIPTQQRCRCGVERTVELFGGIRLREDLTVASMAWRWKQTDGEFGPWCDMATGEPVKIDESKRVERLRDE